MESHPSSRRAPTFLRNCSSEVAVERVRTRRGAQAGRQADEQADLVVEIVGRKPRDLLALDLLAKLRETRRSSRQRPSAGESASTSDPSAHTQPTFILRKGPLLGAGLLGGLEGMEARRRAGSHEADGGCWTRAGRRPGRLCGGQRERVHARSQEGAAGLA